MEVAWPAIIIDRFTGPAERPFGINTYAGRR
jgi:hypothetical protein